MSKFKLILLLIVAVALVDFALENPAPTQELKLFKFALGQVPIYLLAYGGVVVGLLVGWLGHALRIRKKRRLAAAALSQEKQAQAQQDQEPSH
ncbi:MAG: hypothetical protein M1438_00585 [Deltaproteobacteria bacterium]|nr:hypothetical protein [Deltaproteobacteria bacterium]